MASNAPVLPGAPTSVFVLISLALRAFAPRATA